MMIFRYSSINFLFVVGLLVFACTESKERFSLLSAEQTGIDFINKLEPTTEVNIFNYLYFYNGGGVSAGDLNGDELPDLYFVSNQGEDKIYLNLGDFKFQDISDAIGPQHAVNTWSTGVAIVDVNGDGKLDIFKQEVGSYLTISGQNKLYINKGNDQNGVPKFQEMSKQYGLDLVGFGTQAAFLDYDLDGDLDIYQLNHSVHSNGTFGRSKLRKETHPLAGDRFFENTGDRFVEVTAKVGIYSSPLGYGLGIAITDINKDGYPDIYVGNDFHENDYFYLNNGDGTFSENLEQMMQHTSRFSMGNDIADINNDGLMDLVSLDMLPKEYEQLKVSAGEDKFDVFRYKLRYGYNHQYARNTLQLNRGGNKFSEIGLFAGVFATDWSWSSLFADYDLDGYSDLYVANGIVGRTNDLDYIKFISNDAIQRRLDSDMTQQELDLANKMPKVLVPNYAYRNNRDLTFKDVSDEWGLSQKSFSNGAVYADLDLDGDLDLVTNNIDAEAFVYRNNTLEHDPHQSYLTLKFIGDGPNKFGIGCSIKLQTDSLLLVRENYQVRGFQSSVPPTVHFGLGTRSLVDQIEVIWPGVGRHIYENVKANQILVIKESDMQPISAMVEESKPTLFDDVTDQLNVSYTHKENDFVDFNRENLMPHMVSREGPAVAQGDFNGDGLEDLFIGGARFQKSTLMFQTINGTFKSELLKEDSTFENTDVVIGDFDNDGDQDLVVVAGGNEFRSESEYCQIRMLLNDGEGNFEILTLPFDNLSLSAATISSNDYDQDGDLDLFIGSNSIPWNYGVSPIHYFLKNDQGKFTVDGVYNDYVNRLGMLTDAKWGDVDGNGYMDLVVASEWSGIKVLFHGKDSLWMTELESGLWNTVELRDIDHDGRLDILAGNLGLNSKFVASAENPLRMYVDDFDNNGAIEQLITISEDNKEYLFADKDAIVGRLSYIKNTYLDYASFSRADFYEIFPKNQIDKAQKYEITELRSCIFHNTSDGFVKKPLLTQVQIAPMFAFYFEDFDNDGNEDVLTAGNFSGATIQRGKYDASYGELLMYRDQKFQYIDNASHGLYLEGDVKHVLGMNVGETHLLCVVRNNGPLTFYQVNREFFERKIQ